LALMPQIAIEVCWRHRLQRDSSKSEVTQEHASYAHVTLYRAAIQTLSFGEILPQAGYPVDFCMS
jgi:hypothetical protein